MMGWSIGFDSNWGRDIGYGVPAVCDHPNCETKIDRGLGYVCGGEPYGGNKGCGLYFCWEQAHLEYAPTPGEEDSDDPEYSGGIVQLCPACRAGEKPYATKPDLPEWENWKLTDPSWAQWRKENPEQVSEMAARNG